jgi:two-component system CheB/CheR fusion protein
MNVALWVKGQPYGSLEADSTEPFQVADSEIDFLQMYANLVSAAVERSLLDSQIEGLAAERQILLNEVFHRIKNMLANIDAMARRTVQHSETLAEFQDAFRGRIGALSRAYDLLLVAPDKPVQLRELLALEFEAKGLREGEQFRLSGSEVLCSPRTIQVLALLIFELATNAVKYGAISERASGRGCICVSWKVEQHSEQQHAVLAWRETGVDTIESHGKRGFGLELIERVVPGMLHGTAELTMHDDGIECIVTFPLNNDFDLPSTPLQTGTGTGCTTGLHFNP